MEEEFRAYLITLYQGIPQEVYEGLLSVACLGLAVIVALKGFRAGMRWFAVLLLLEYLFLLFSSTVIFRSYDEGQGHNFTPFWSYTAIQEGRTDLIIENLMNVVAFVPIGLLLVLGFRRMKLWQVLMAGVGISVSIETLQLVFSRGFAELDDVFHNTLGCLMGCILATIVKTRQQYEE